MSASSGITVTPDLSAAFASAAKSNTVRFIKVVIQNGLSFITHSTMPTNLILLCRISCSRTVYQYYWIV